VDGNASNYLLLIHNSRPDTNFSDKDGDIKCGYSYESPLELHLFRIDPDNTRWDARYHLRQQNTFYGHPALYEFGKIYDCELGRVWNTWVRDKSKLEISIR
jgi:hypothetical protein